MQEACLQNIDGFYKKLMNEPPTVGCMVWQLGVFCGRLTVKTCKAYGGVMLDKSMIGA